MIEDLIKDKTNTLFIATYADLRDAMYSVLAEIEEKKREGNERLYTPSEFAEKHKVTKMTLNRWVRAGILKQTRYGGKVFYRESDLKEG